MVLSLDLRLILLKVTVGCCSILKGGSKILGAVVPAESNLQQSSMANAVKDPSPRPAQEKKPLILTSNGHGVAPAAK